ncbi:MAG: HAD family hydrolase [Candidatus Avelusimicrobium sp.]|uniref:HAD family hydrolase n=1 Tax=Candidatus Avelusimicrobium sp. TaxID=3048833 RepID=UPI003F055EEC
MKNLLLWLAVPVFCCGAFAPAPVFAQGKNPVKFLRQSQKAVSALESKNLEQLRRAASSAAALRAAAFAGTVKAGSSAASVPSALSHLPKASSALTLPAPVPLSIPGTLSAKPVVFPGKETVDAVIFDLDGTLLDSLSAWEHSGTNFLRTQGITPPEGLDEKLVKMSLMDGARLLKEMFSLPQEPEEILRLTLDPIRRHYFEDIPAKPGVPETLRRLKAQGVKLCVATASDGELARAALARLELLDLFDFVLTCDEVGVGKRSPAVYEEALRRLGTEKSRTLVAEDAPYALQTARRAGFMTAGVADPHTLPEGARQMRAEADFYVETFLEGVYKK